MKERPYVLAADIRQYFPSIDHEILMGDLERVIKCKPTLALAARIIGSGAPDSHPDPHGLPLGNQTSQFFANVYLNPLDHFAQRRLGGRPYMRYVDDFLLFGDDKSELGEARERIAELLAGRRLRLHPAKTRVHRVCDGVTFLGWRLFPGHRRLVRGNVVRFRRRLGSLLEDYADGLITRERLDMCMRSWIAHAAHGDTWRLRRQIFEANPVVPPPKIEE